ncbi:DUF1444 family protein [Maribacter sp. BPC-D8]|uniref:DUF1444 family protein n=1 Tax=Maribacter sp. BPC-D8 TaxID=3053613 RepID=UPI002B45C90B|nr:DUF1444 family protein [Maribacter sp. BPC-D8]WRI30233.1 DUF1444 family protein [Maribacter sp. BPC-D8]
MSFLKKLFKKEPVNHKVKKGLETPVEEIKKEREGYVSIGRSIFPVIKSVDDERIKMSQNKNPIIMEPIAEGIVKCYVLDMGDKFEMISQSHLDQFNFDREIVDNTAMRNLTDRFNERNSVSVQDFSQQNTESKPFYKLEMDANYPPSMMLVDEFWDNTVQQIVKSDTIAVSIPAKNLLFFSDMKLMESFRTMKPVAKHMYDASVQDNIQLTENTYIRKNGKWILFLDTPEQMEELW